MKCPYCSAINSKVIDTRETKDAIRRRRECLGCKKRFTTYERVDIAPLIVIKKDKTRETFDRNKLRNGILKACEKRPIPLEKIEKIVDNIEQKLRKRGKREVTSKLIGELVMTKLKKLDKIAYIRFASVYREFQDIRSFEQEIKKIKKG